MSKNKNVTFGWAVKNIIWPRKNTLLIGLLLIIISRPAGLVLPAATKYLLDDAVPNKDVAMLQLIVTIIVISLIVQAVCSFLLTRILSVEAQYLISELRVKVQKKKSYLYLSTSSTTINRARWSLE